jgi:hypothetical protein
VGGPEYKVSVQDSGRQERFGVSRSKFEQTGYPVAHYAFLVPIIYIIFFMYIIINTTICVALPLLVCLEPMEPENTADFLT